jgi:hypothetical protein
MCLWALCCADSNDRVDDLKVNPLHAALAQVGGDQAVQEAMNLRSQVHTLLMLMVVLMKLDCAGRRRCVRT